MNSFFRRFNVSCKCSDGVSGFASSITMELANVFCKVKFQFASIFLPTANSIEVLSLFFLFRAEKMTFKQSDDEGKEENIRLVEL